MTASDPSLRKREARSDDGTVRFRRQGTEGVCTGVGSWERNRAREDGDRVGRRIRGQRTQEWGGVMNMKRLTEGNLVDARHGVAKKHYQDLAVGWGMPRLGTQ